MIAETVLKLVDRLGSSITAWRVLIALAIAAAFSFFAASVIDLISAATEVPQLWLYFTVLLASYAVAVLLVNGIAAGGRAASRAWSIRKRRQQLRGQMEEEIQVSRRQIQLMLAHLTTEQADILERLLSGHQVLRNSDHVRGLSELSVIIPILPATALGGTLHALNPTMEDVVRAHFAVRRAEHLQDVVDRLTADEQRFLELFTVAASIYEGAPAENSSELLPYDVYTAGSSLVWNQVLEFKRHADGIFEEFQLRDDAHDAIADALSYSFKRRVLKLRTDRIAASGAGGSGAGSVPLPRVRS